MGGGAAAHAKMHQPVFFWWRLKVVCAVPGMIQCSWRRCMSGLRAHALLSAGREGSWLSRNISCPEHAPQTAVGPYF